MINTFKYSTLSCAILAIIMINSCGIFPESCPDDVTGVFETKLGAILNIDGGVGRRWQIHDNSCITE